MIFNRNLPQVKCPFKMSSMTSTEIDFVESYKYLSIWPNNKLTYDAHI